LIGAYWLCIEVRGGFGRFGGGGVGRFCFLVLLVLGFALYLCWSCLGGGLVCVLVYWGVGFVLGK